MPASVFTPKSESYLEEVAARVARLTPHAIAARVIALTNAHESWRAGECLNMNPAEGLMSRGSRRLLDSDMATRVTEGLPGDKIFPHYRQTAFIDEIEATIVALARSQFGARFVEWRPTSTSMANAAAFFALLEPGDSMLVQSLEGGGNYAYQPEGPAGLSKARVVTIPGSSRTFEIDPEQVATLARQVKPKMIVIGGGKVLFPYPLRALREIADSVGAILLYDAAHLGLLISAGQFQRPLQEGAHLVTVSTHKVMGGPVGGLVLTNDASIASRIMRLTFPGLLQTRDQNKYAALALTLAELQRFGPELATQMVRNAQALATALANKGFSVIDRGGVHTQTHQVILELGAQAATFEWRCQAANILIPDCALNGDVAKNRRTGARIGVHEITRLGMREPEMIEVAGLVRRAFDAVDGSAAAAIAAEVRGLLGRFPGVVYGFDDVEWPGP